MTKVFLVKHPNSRVPRIDVSSTISNVIRIRFLNKEICSLEAPHGFREIKSSSILVALIFFPHETHAIPLPLSLLCFCWLSKDMNQAVIRELIVHGNGITAVPRKLGRLRFQTYLLDKNTLGETADSCVIETVISGPAVG